MVAELFRTEDREFQTAGVVMPNALFSREPSFKIDYERTSQRN